MFERYRYPRDTRETLKRHPRDTQKTLRRYSRDAQEIQQKNLKRCWRNTQEILKRDMVRSNKMCMNKILPTPSSIEHVSSNKLGERTKRQRAYRKQKKYTYTPTPTPTYADRRVREWPNRSLPFRIKTAERVTHIALVQCARRASPAQPPYRYRNREQQRTGNTHAPSARVRARAKAVPKTAKKKGDERFSEHTCDTGKTKKTSVNQRHFIPRQSA